MSRKSKILPFALVMVLVFSNIYSYASSSYDKVEPINVQSNQQLIVKNFDEIVKTSNNLSVSDLKSIRDNLVKKNYEELYLKKTNNTPKKYNDYYDSFIDGEFGMDKFFERRFCKKKIGKLYKKEIELLTYYNDNDFVFSDINGFIPNTYDDFEIFQFRKNFNKEKSFKKYDILNKTEKETLYNYYFDNIEKIIEQTDSDIVYLVDLVYPENEKGLDKSFVSRLQESYKNKLSKYKFDKFDQRIKDFDKEIESRSIQPLKIK